MKDNNKVLIKNIEIKSTDNKGLFSGFASVFNVIDDHNDYIMPGAFLKTISENPEIKLLWQHDHAQPIGLITSIEEKEDGLYIEGELLLDVVKAKEAYALMKKRVVDSLSIGYEVLDYYYEDGVRFIKELRLWEVSVVTFPANRSAQILHVKSDSEKSLENSLERAIDVLEI